jgi:polyhydroxyalkanoate synthase
MVKARKTGLPASDAVERSAAQWSDQIEQINHAMDPFGIGASFRKVSEGWLANPEQLAATLSQLTRDVQSLQLNAWQTATGLKPDPVQVPKPDDERFTDPVWNESAPFSLLKQYYLLYTHWLEESLFDAPDTPAKERRHAAFWARQWLNAIAPNNYLYTNPVALKKFWESGGASLTHGLKQWLDDLRSGDVQMVDRSAFQVGKNMALSPGSVVYRNELMELIQYAPTTEKVHALPIVIFPPWINKYYIIDLNEKKSLIRYLVAQGFTVFVVSWRNPTAAQADTTFDDYLMQGMREAVDAARAICGTSHVHAVGYCIGGTALTAMMAWYNAEYPDPAQVPIAHWTLFATLVDFSRPGGIEVFLNEETINSLEAMMAQQGFLEGRDMARAFRLLRSNSLIWHYFVHNYLYGETPPAFDVLFWNTDVTRMPRAMHAFYLREFYLHNKLMQKDGLNLAGHAIDLGRIRQPLYAVGCEEDHIAPWKATFKIAGKLQAPVQYTLSSSGHILGIINPPVTPPKRCYWSSRCADQSPDEWKRQCAEVQGTWWPHWTQYLAQQCGPLVPARPPGSAQYPALHAAPGLYVQEI